MMTVSPRPADSAGTPSARLDLGTFLPTSTPDPAQPILGDIGAAARLAEELGLDSVWSTDHLVASAPILDSTVALATAAAVTERIRIGWGVLVVSLRPAAWAAKQAATLQYTSGNRLLLGVGTGNPAHSDIAWRAADQPHAERGRRTDEALRVLPDLIAGRPAVLADGTEVTLSPGASVPPILVAGNGSRAMRRAAAYADGWLAIGLSPDESALAATELADLADAVNRPAPQITIVTPPTGDLAQTVDTVSAHAAANVERVILAPADPDWRAHYEFAAKVKAALPS
ncbi:LLM class flavin-dependent oxidoreductase [Nocardia albiluteola]|nr:LLM class flavin-dependent oxidoreductase [Nocardia albiluteola]